MPMSDEIDEIRRRKLSELRAAADAAGDESASRSPSEPIPIGGRAELDRTIAEHDPVLVDFSADWCGPCRMLEPVVERVAAETDAAVATVDIDANQRLAADYSVRSVPTLLLFDGGQPAERLVGMQDESRLRSVIEAHA